MPCNNANANNACRCMNIHLIMYSNYICYRSEYAIATKSENKDQKLAHMCRGMWAKLQFFYSKKKSLRKTEKLRNGVNTHFVSLR